MLAALGQQEGTLFFHHEGKRVGLATLWLVREAVIFRGSVYLMQTRLTRSIQAFFTHVCTNKLSVF